MSAENVELVRRFYPPGTFDLVPLLDDTDRVESLRPLVHPEFEMVGAALAMEGPPSTSDQDLTRRAVYGVEGFLEGWRVFLAAWESWVVTPTEFIDLDDERVLVLLDIRARSKTHGVEIPIEGANLVTIRDGRFFRVELFSTKPEALEAAGLSE